MTGHNHESFLEHQPVVLDATRYELDYLTHNGDPDDPFPMLEHVFNAGETVLRKLRSKFSEGSEGMEAP